MTPLGHVAGMGVEFIHTDAEQKRQILQLVEFARTHGDDPNLDAGLVREQGQQMIEQAGLLSRGGRSHRDRRR